MFVTLDLSRDRNVSIFPRFGGQRKEMSREFLQRLALLFIRFFVNINVVEIPLAERFEHALVLGALNELAHRQPVQRNLSVMAFADEDNLSAVTRHSRWQGFKPARTGRTAGTGLLELSSYFP